MICRLCQSHHLQLIYSKNLYQIWRCRTCGFASLTPLPHESDLNQIYHDDHYHEDKTLADHQADTRVKLNFLQPQLKPGAKILDYGCGNGMFLALARHQGYDCVGYDISRNSAQQARHLSGCQVKTGKPNRNLFNPHAFDVIVAFDVLEHIENFDAVLNWCQSWLKPYGRLIITTPDLSSWDYRLLKTHWFGFTKIPQHLNYFDRVSIKLALTQQHFYLDTIKTWGFSRSLTFIAGKLPGKHISYALLNFSQLAQKTIYLPMINMMVLASKK